MPLQSLSGSASGSAQTFGGDPIALGGVYATNIPEFFVNPNDGDTLTVGNFTYTFRDNVSQLFDVQLDDFELDSCIQNMADAINAIPDEAGIEYFPGIPQNPYVLCFASFHSMFIRAAEIGSAYNNVTVSTNDEGTIFARPPFLFGGVDPKYAVQVHRILTGSSPGLATPSNLAPQIHRNLQASISASASPQGTMGVSQPLASAHATGNASTGLADPLAVDIGQDPFGAHGTAQIQAQNLAQAHALTASPIPGEATAQTSNLEYQFGFDGHIAQGLAISHLQGFPMAKGLRSTLPTATPQVQGDLTVQTIRGKSFRVVLIVPDQNRSASFQASPPVVLSSGDRTAQI